MKTIEYKDTVLQVPEKWHDITLGHYEGFYRMPTTNAEETIHIVAAICKTDATTLRELPAEIFMIIFDTVQFIFKNDPLPASAFIEKDGIKWIVPIEDTLTLGEWVDVEQAQKGDLPLSGTLAVICRPAGEKYDAVNNEAREKFFAGLSVEEVRPLLGFFLQCKTVSKQHFAVYGSLAQVLETLPSNIGDLLKRTDGIKLLRIWQIIRYIYLRRLLKRRLQRYLLSYSTKKTARR